jgi:hypothetical protein
VVFIYAWFNEPSIKRSVFNAKPNSQDKNKERYFVLGIIIIMILVLLNVFLDVLGKTK